LVLQEKWSASNATQAQLHGQRVAAKAGLHNGKEHQDETADGRVLETLPERIHTEVRRLNTVVNVIPIVSA
jgi:hypothetical protein